MSVVTQRQIEFFLGGDNLENSCLIELEALANGSYKPKQFKEDVLNGEQILNHVEKNDDCHFTAEL